MGEIYRARDARLNRDVAIKVLPASFASDAERLQRFELEAKAAGQLNHPNVLTVFDVGSIDGAPYLVTELLDGETLRERLTHAHGASQTSLGARKTLDIGRQIALGLAAAHGAGIVHRDLKPENIFLTRDGRVKLLDFGLAQVVEQPADRGSAATALRVTNPGTVLGTIGYMAPEQIRGRQVDARADVFALGAVLFEVASGRRAFDRDSSADTLAAILKEDPPDLSSSGVVVPPALDRIIRRCLEKNPDERFQSARDLAFAIEAVEGSSPATTLSGAVPAIEPRRRGRASQLLAALVIVGLGIAAVAGYVVGRIAQPGAASGSSLPRFDIKQVTFDVDQLLTPALSPDGTLVAFVKQNPAGDPDIYVQRVGGENPIDLTKDSRQAEYQPAFSQDGRQIAFRSDRGAGGIFVMGSTGENVRRLTDEGFNPAWSPDGTEIAYSTSSIFDPTTRNEVATIWRVNVDTGAKVKVADADAVQPAWSPDGKFIVFWGLEGTTGRRCLYTVPSAGGARTKIVDDDSMNWNPIWSKDGYVYFLSDQEPPMNLWRLPINPSTGAAAGPAERLTASTQPYSWLTRSPGGGMAVAVTANTCKVDRYPFSIDTGSFGAATTILNTTRAVTNISASPDGRLLAFTATDASEDLVVMKTDGTGMVRLTNDRFRDRQAHWSADSSTVYFGSNRSGPYEIWRVSADGGPLESVARKAAWALVVPVVSPDNKYLAVLAVVPKLQLELLDLSSPVAGRVLRDIAPPEVPGPVAPIGWLKDGRLVANAATNGKDSQIVLYNPATRTSTSIATPNLLFTALAADRYVFSSDFKVIDLTTGKIRAISGFPSRGDSTVSPDAKFIYTASTTTVTNVWMLTAAVAK
jgi:serine/threonine protein kinase/Tol biopolymer transport system component